MRKLALPLLLLLATSAFAAGRPLAPRDASPTSYSVSNHHVAFAGERFLTVWVEDMGNVGRPLLGSFSDAFGRRVSTLAFPLFSSLRGTPLQLVGLGDAYVLFWRTESDVLRMTEIALDGRVLRTADLALPQLFQMYAAWNGERLLIVGRHLVANDYDAEGFLLERDGTVVRSRIRLHDAATELHAIGDGNGFAIATGGYDGVRAHRVTPGGDAITYYVDDTPAYDVLVSPAANGLLVTRAVGTLLRASVVGANGTIGPLFTIAESDVPMALVHVRRTGDANLVTYRDLGSANSGVASLLVHADNTVTPAPALAVSFPPRAYTFLSAAASDSATLVVYVPPEIYPSPLMQVATAGEGTPGGPDFVAYVRSRQSQPILAEAGGRVLAAWSEIHGRAAFLRAVSLARDATPLADTPVALAYLAARELPWNGSEYLAVSARDAFLYATRVALDGTPLDGEPLLVGWHQTAWPHVEASAAWAGDRWVVVWQSGHEIRFATIRNGTVSPWKKLALGDRPASRPVLGANGSALLLAWTEADPPACGMFPPCIGGESYGFAARITPDGDVAIAERIALPQKTTNAIATSGSEFFLLGGTTATIVDAGISRVVASKSIFNWPASGDVTWDGASYAVALRYAGMRWYVSVTHYDRTLAPIGTPRGTTTLPPDNWVAPSIAGGIVGVQEGDAAQGLRAVAYREADMPPLPTRPTAPTNVQVTPLGEGRFEITWDESSGAEMYRIFGFYSGFPFLIADVRADQPRRIVAASGSVRVVAFNAAGASDPLPRRRSVRR